MKDKELDVDLEYLDAYNGGYHLHGADQALADEYLRRLKLKNEKDFSQKDKGMKDGILQGRIEAMQKDLDDIFDEKKSKKRGMSH